MCLVLRVRLRKKKLEPTLNTSPTNFCINNQDLTLMIINHVLLVS